MLNTIIKTKTQMHSVNTDISQIIDEVKKHGFYSAFCNSLMPDIMDHYLRINEIRKLAIAANLRVTFNSTKTICIFEEI